MLPYKIHLAIVGSRTFTDKNRFNEWVTEALTGWGATVKDIGNIISGGACGADTLAEQYARDNNLSLVVYRPDWKTHGRAAGILRNTDIVQASTHVIAFPSKVGRGTQDSIKKALASKKITKVYYID